MQIAEFFYEVYCIAQNNELDHFRNLGITGGNLTCIGSELYYILGSWYQ